MIAPMLPSILTFLPHYTPGFKAGGPLVSIKNLAANLSSEFTFSIITSDRDLADEHPYRDIPSGKWTEVEGTRVLYLPTKHLILSAMKALLRETPHDILYLNSFFNPRFSITPLALMRLGFAPLKPIIVAPRGEFSPGALRQKAMKKQAFLALAKASGFYRGVTWHASSALEAEHIITEIGPDRTNIAIAPNIPKRNFDLQQAPVKRLEGDPIRIAFISRISPKKNLLFALETLRHLKVPAIFSIYGPKEDPAYWERCAAKITALPKHIDAQYFGALTPERVSEVLAQQDLLFFPTLGENYGHIIVESFQAGTPVLLSDQTPWRDLHASGVGAEFALTQVTPFRNYIESIAQAPLGERQAMRLRVLDFGNRVSKNDRAIDAHRDMFLQARATKIATSS